MKRMNNKISYNKAKIFDLKSQAQSIKHVLSRQAQELADKNGRTVIITTLLWCPESNVKIEITNKLWVYSKDEARSN